MGAVGGRTGGKTTVHRGSGKTGSHRAVGTAKSGTKGTGSHGGKESTRNHDTKTGRASTKGGKKAGSDARAPKRRKPRVTLAIWLKFTIPVAIISALVIFIGGSYINRVTKRSLMNEILKSGITGVSMLAAHGSQLLQVRQNDPAWWPVTLEYMDRQQLYEYAGKDAPEEPVEEWPALTPQEISIATNRASILRPFINIVSKQGQGQNSHFLAAYLLGGNQLVGRSDGDMAMTPADATKLNIPSDNWLPPRVRKIDEVDFKTEKIQAGPSRTYEIIPGTLKIGDQEYGVLTFSVPVYSQEEKPKNLGKVHLCMRADVVVNQIGEITNTLLLVGACTIVLSVAICIVIALRVTSPIKQLLHDMEVVAQGDLTHRTRAHSTDEIGLIASEFNYMTQNLLAAQEAEKEIQRVENELEVAREIQMKLLPPRLPVVRGFDLHAVYKPAREVGGDYYDFIPIGKRRMGLVVADVSGKGIPGSMVMGTTRTILRFVATGNASSADTLSRTNAMVALDIRRGMFVTAFYLVLDALEKTVLCSSAGHNPMYLMRASGKLEQVNPNGIALGFDKGPIFSRTIKEQELKLETGDRVVLYTDGVVEAMNSKNEEYTDERFCKFIKKHSALSSEEFVKALLADLGAHKGKAEQHDDITVVTFRLV